MRVDAIDAGLDRLRELRDDRSGTLPKRVLPPDPARTRLARGELGPAKLHAVRLPLLLGARLEAFAGERGRASAVIREALARMLPPMVDASTCEALARAGASAPAERSERFATCGD